MGPSRPKQPSSHPAHLGTSPSSTSGRFGQQAREQCYYGSQCRQLNTDHKRRFAHPNDDDWVVRLDQGDKDARPPATTANGTSDLRDAIQHSIQEAASSPKSPRLHTGHGGARVRDDAASLGISPLARGLHASPSKGLGAG